MADIPYDGAGLRERFLHALKLAQRVSPRRLLLSLADINALIAILERGEDLNKALGSTEAEHRHG